MSIAKKFGDLVREERLKHLMSQEELAEYAGLHRNAIGLIERGERVPNLETLLAIAKGLNIAASSLLLKLEETE